MKHSGFPDISMISLVAAYRPHEAEQCCLCRRQLPRAIPRNISTGSDIGSQTGSFGRHQVPLLWNPGRSIMQPRSGTNTTRSLQTAMQYSSSTSIQFSKVFIVRRYGYV